MVFPGNSVYSRQHSQELNEKTPRTHVLEQVRIGAVLP